MSAGATARVFPTRAPPGPSRREAERVHEAVNELHGP